jgi:hypothetical protein
MPIRTQVLDEYRLVNTNAKGNCEMVIVFLGETAITVERELR